MVRGNAPTANATRAPFTYKQDVADLLMIVFYFVSDSELPSKPGSHVLTIKEEKKRKVIFPSSQFYRGSGN